MRALFKVRYKVFGGRNGGVSGVYAFKTTASSAKDAGRKLRTKNARVISVRMIKRLS